MNYKSSLADLASLRGLSATLTYHLNRCGDRSVAGVLWCSRSYPEWGGCGLIYNIQLPKHNFDRFSRPPIPARCLSFSRHSSNFSFCTVVKSNMSLNTSGHLSTLFEEHRSRLIDVALRGMHLRSPGASVLSCMEFSLSYDSFCWLYVGWHEGSIPVSYYKPALKLSLR